MSNSNQQSGEISEQNPFSRKSKVLRSPTLKNTFPKNETIASQVKENVIGDSNTNEKINNLEKLCESLKRKIDDLTSENQRLKSLIDKKITDMPMETDSAKDEFHTDEEELARETDWILKKNKKRESKKRKAIHSPEMDSFVKPAVTKSNDKTAKKPKLPPVILSNIDDFNEVQVIMKSQNVKYEIKLLNNKQLSIKVNSEDDYRNITKAINEAKFEWHSYENKATRPCRVIARGLHPKCPINSIEEDLKDLGFKVLSVSNLTRKIKDNEKQKIVQLPLFMISFDHSEDIP